MDTDGRIVGRPDGRIEIVGIASDGALDLDGEKDVTTDGTLDGSAVGTGDGTWDSLRLGDSVGENVSCNGVTESAAFELFALASSLESIPLTDLAAKNPAHVAATIKATSAKHAS